MSRSSVVFVARKRRRSIFIRIVDNAFHAIRKDVRIESSRLRNRRIAGDTSRIETKMDDMMRALVDRMDGMQSAQDEFNRKLLDRMDNMQRAQDEFNRLFVDRLTRLEDKVDLIGKCNQSKLDEMAQLEDRMVQLFMKIDTVATTTDKVRRISLNNTMLAVSVAEKSGVTQNEISELVGIVHRHVEE